MPKVTCTQKMHEIPAFHLIDAVKEIGEVQEFIKLLGHDIKVTAGPSALYLTRPPLKGAMYLHEDNWLVYFKGDFVVLSDPQFNSGYTKITTI